MTNLTRRIYPNPDYIKKDKIVVALLNLLGSLGILDNITVDNHGYVHRVTGLHYYVEEIQEI